MRIAEHAATIARAYAAVWFCESPWVGAWFALVTASHPRAALSGLAGLLAAQAWARVLRMPAAGNAHLVNGLLCGLFIGASHPATPGLAGLIASASILVALSTPWLASLFWRAGKLPVLSLPFALVIGMMLLALGPYGLGLEPVPAPLLDTSDVLPRALEHFFTAVGWLLLVPHPLSGALIFCGLLIASRYLALLAASGYVAGVITLEWLGHNGNPNVAFNFMLAAVAVGGIFTVPGRASFLMALAAGALSAWFCLMLGAIFALLQIPLLTLPFIAAVLLCLGALAARVDAGTPHLTLDEPGLPERAHERARLALARGADAHSVPLAAPFYGEWTVTQGFDGEQTHRAPWQHALDFQITENGHSHRNDGLACTDYFCFGAPVLAPAAGQVILVQNDLPDMPPGHVDTVNNWGNVLLIRTATGVHVMLAHLKHGSVTATAGEWVTAGQVVGACGSSGRSPVPHLHLQVQTGAELGSPTQTFHLTNVIERCEGSQRDFQLCTVPREGSTVTPAPADDRVTRALRIPLGSTLTYVLSENGETASEHQHFSTSLTLLGQRRITTRSGASAAYEETASAIGYYDRAGASDPALDLWLLALGLTPLSASASRWRDRPAMMLLPLNAPRRALAALLRPLGGGCNSVYTRSWDDQAQCWLQEGHHQLRLLPGLTWLARTRAWIVPEKGVIQIRLEMFNHCRELTLRMRHG